MARTGMRHFPEFSIRFEVIVHTRNFVYFKLVGNNYRFVHGASTHLWVITS